MNHTQTIADRLERIITRNNVANTGSLTGPDLATHPEGTPVTLFNEHGVRVATFENAVDAQFYLDMRRDLPWVVSLVLAMTAHEAAKGGADGADAPPL